MERKICADCKHFYEITGITPSGSYFCKRVKNLINGSDTACYQVRYDNELCGIDGRYFEEKEKTEPTKKRSLMDKLLGRNSHEQ